MSIPAPTPGPDQVRRLAAIDALAAGFRERASKYDQQASFPEENFQDLAAGGLLALTVPAKWGGQELWGAGGFVDYYEILERVAGIDPPTGQLLQVHSHALGMLSHVATEEQAQKHIVPIVRAGQLVASIGSESVPGKTNAGNSTSELARDAAGRWVLTCEKHFASLGPGADHLIIWTALPGAGGYDSRIVAVLVPRAAPEVELINNWDTLGMRATVSWGVRINGFVVPDDALFGAAGWWESDARTFTLGFAANHVGSARGALEFTIGWVRERPHLAGDPLVQYALGEMSADLQAARASLFTAARLWETGAAAEAEFASVQALAVAKKISLQVTQRAFDVCGARAIFRNHQLEQIFRDTRTFTLHYRVDGYVRDLGAALIADAYDQRGNGGVVARWHTSATG
jgi:alkylation response protein AidB-like acyl-CoA dehydrogenase